MPEPVREQILAAITSRLEAIDGLVVERDRLGGPAQGVAKAAHVFDGGQDPVEDPETGTDTFIMTVLVDLYVDAPSDGDKPSTLLNRLYAEAIVAVGSKIAGLAHTITETKLELTPTFQRGDLEGHAQLGLGVIYDIKRGDPMTPRS